MLVVQRVRLLDWVKQVLEYSRGREYSQLEDPIFCMRCNGVWLDTSKVFL